MSSTIPSRLVVVVILILCATTASGCASVISRTHQTVQLQSDTPGTTVVVKEVETSRVFGPVKTPAWTTLNKNHNYVVEFTHPEGEVLTFQPQRTFDPVTLINILGLLGFVGDIFTGAIEKFDSTAWSANFASNQVMPVVPVDLEGGQWGRESSGNQSDAGETDGATDGATGGN